MGVAYGNLGELLRQARAGALAKAKQPFASRWKSPTPTMTVRRNWDSLVNLAHLHQQQGRWHAALDAYAAAIALIDTLRAGVSTESAPLSPRSPKPLPTRY